MLNELDNCGDYDVYTLERPACGAIGCAALSHVLWVSALISFGATVGWTAVFYARCLQERQAQQRALWHKHFMALFACLGFLLLTAVVVGFAGGSGAVLVMAFLCPLLPVCLWVLAAWLAFLPATGEEAKRAKRAIPCTTHMLYEFLAAASSFFCWVVGRLCTSYTNKNLKWQKLRHTCMLIMHYIIQLIVVSPLSSPYPSTHKPYSRGP